MYFWSLNFTLYNVIISCDAVLHYIQYVRSVLKKICLEDASQEEKWCVDRRKGIYTPATQWLISLFVLFCSRRSRGNWRVNAWAGNVISYSGQYREASPERGTFFKRIGN